MNEKGKKKMENKQNSFRNFLGTFIVRNFILLKRRHVLQGLPALFLSIFWQVEAISPGLGQCSKFKVIGLPIPRWGMKLRQKSILLKWYILPKCIENKYSTLLVENQFKVN